MSMKLHWSPRSPFVRKVMIVLDEAGLNDQVERVRSVVAMASPPNPDVLSDNPLAKIPTLLTEQGMALFDSRVICEYLDYQSHAGLFPDVMDVRIQQLCWQALADGLTDILLLWRNELHRDGGPWQVVCDGYETKVKATMAQLDQEAKALSATGFGIGHVALVCALGQLDFRWSGSGWEQRFPALFTVYQDLCQRPSVAAHPIVDDAPAGDDVSVLQF